MYAGGGGTTESILARGWPNTGVPRMRVIWGIVLSTGGIGLERGLLGDPPRYCLNFNAPQMRQIKKPGWETSVNGPKTWKEINWRNVPPNNKGQKTEPKT